MVYDTAIRTGDKVKWESPIFSGGSFSGGRYRGGAKFVGTEIFDGIIEKHSYGAKTEQHTFSVRLTTGQLKLVKGRNLYPNIILHCSDCQSPDRANNGATLVR